MSAGFASQVEAANEVTFTRVAAEFSRLAAALPPGHVCSLAKTGGAAHQVARSVMALGAGTHTTAPFHGPFLWR